MTAYPYGHVIAREVGTVLTWASGSAHTNLHLADICHLSDRDLIEQLRRGSHDAFDTIFRTYYARMVGAAEALLGDRAAAEEAAQDVMLALWRRRESITIETALAAYLFRSVRNRGLNQIRQSQTIHRAEPHLEADAGTPTQADARVRSRELNIAFHDAVESLPP